MKKSGIIVGVILFILALAIYWVATGLTKEEEVPKPTEQVQKPTESVKTPQKGTGEEKATPPVKEPQTSQEPPKTSEPVLQPPVSPSKSFFTMSDGDMGIPEGQFKEDMTVVKKNVTVLDYKPGTSEGKQMVYTVDLKGKKRDITIFVNGEVYYGLVLGRELSVTYSIYTNDSGIDFPVVDNVVEVIK